MSRITTVKIKVTDLMNAARNAAPGEVFLLVKIPALATILTSSESIMEQIIMKDEIEIQYSIDTDPTVSIAIGDKP